MATVLPLSSPPLLPTRWSPPPPTPAKPNECPIQKTRKFYGPSGGASRRKKTRSVCRIRLPILPLLPFRRRRGVGWSSRRFPPPWGWPPRCSPFPSRPHCSLRLRSRGVPKGKGNERRGDIDRGSATTRPPPHHHRCAVRHDKTVVGRRRPRRRTNRFRRPALHKTRRGRRCILPLWTKPRWRRRTRRGYQLPPVMKGEGAICPHCVPVVSRVVGVGVDRTPTTRPCDPPGWMG